MASKTFHRKHFIASAAAGLLVAVGLKTKPTAKRDVDANRSSKAFELVRKDPRSVSVKTDHLS